MHSRIAAALIAVCALGSSVSGQQLVVVSSNVESGDASPAWIGREIIEKIDAHIWGFSEVDGAEWAASFKEAAEEAYHREYRSILGTTGDRDRLLILYDDDLLDHVETIELHELNIGGGVRAPLIARLRLTVSGREFLFMVNHLYRGNAGARHVQATKLNAWARQQQLPVIAVGDYNFDWNLPKGEKDHDKGYDNLTRDGVFTWTRPPVLVQTQCSQSFNSVLDFVFVSGEARTWKASSEIKFREPAYCNDDSQRPDHRPVTASFTIPGTDTDPLSDVLAHLDALMTEVQKQIAALSAGGNTLTDAQKRTLARLREMLRQLEEATAAAKK
jgi:endonuclease/exonuclease/phosphatase family metal-dependent hydrolase